MRQFGNVKRTAVEVLSTFWDLLPSLGTPLGRLAKDLKLRGVSPDDKIQPEGGADLLPLRIEVRVPLKLLLHVLNYLSMGGRDNPRTDLTIPESLSQAQQTMVEHVSASD